MKNKAAEQEGQGEKKATFKFYLVDGGMPYFGGYKAGSMTDGEPQLFFNCEAVMEQIKDEPKDEMAVSFKDIMLSTLTHEFCHAMQEWLAMEFDELQVEKILGAYNEKWNVFGGEEELQDDSEEAVFKINDMLRFLDNEPESDLKEKIKGIFNAHDLWRKAHEQHAIKNPPTPLQPSGTGEEKCTCDFEFVSIGEERVKYSERDPYCPIHGEEGEKELTQQKVYDKDQFKKPENPFGESPSAGHRDSEEVMELKRKYNSLYEQTTKDATAFKQTIALQEQEITKLKADLEIYMHQSHVFGHYIDSLPEEESFAPLPTPKDKKISEQEQTIRQLKELLQHKGVVGEAMDRQIGGMQLTIDSYQESNDHYIRLSMEQEQRIKDLEQKNGFQEFRIKELEKALTEQINKYKYDTKS